MADTVKKKVQSQLDVLVNANPHLKKELERRIKAARTQGASLSEAAKEELRYKLVNTERQLEAAGRQIERLEGKIKLQDLAVIAGDGNSIVGQLKIKNVQLEAENENLKLALHDLQKTYARLVNNQAKSKTAR